MSSSQVLDPAGSVGVIGTRSTSEVLARLAAAVTEAASVNLDVLDGDGLLAEQRAFEKLGRQVDSIATGLAGRVDQTRAHGLDGHMNAKACLRHIGQLPGGEALGRVRASRALRDLPNVKAAYEAGDLSTGHVREFARVWANPRVQHLLPISEEPLLANARVSSYREFRDLMADWERLADADGAKDRNDAASRRRDVTLRQRPDLSWEAQGSFDSFRGAVLADVLEHYAKLERAVDWDVARAEHGDDACFQDLPRTEAQRRADAWCRIAEVAAKNAPGRRESEPLVSLHIDNKTFDEELARMFGQAVETDLDDFEDRRCSTMSGHPIHPEDAVLAALYGRLRRVVFGADDAVINMGKAQRFFTGSARDAALLAHPVCTHPGCDIASQDCEADHMLEWVRLGLTDATTNGNPRCGFHNKLKNHGYRTWRDADGVWHSTRPDGTPIH